MELKTVIYYRNAYAHYRIKRESKGVYHAELLSYDGKKEDTPCASATLVRGVTRWWGCDDKEILQLLSEAILSLTDSGLYFTEK